jgi:hypothetical protein
VTASSAGKLHQLPKQEKHDAEWSVRETDFEEVARIGYPKVGSSEITPPKSASVHECFPFPEIGFGAKHFLTGGSEVITGNETVVMLALGSPAGPHVI